jgi:SAM-dependent methyltransferase
VNLPSRHIPHPAQDPSTAGPAAARPAAERWTVDLAAWRIPDEIIAAAPQSPWIHPVTLFDAEDGPTPDSHSHATARERLDEQGSVLDVGCGGGRAAFAVAPPAAVVTGVDHQQAMLDAFAAAAVRRGLQHHEVLGDWPEVAPRTPEADVVVCHHVTYNVADLGAFVVALDTHARRRVVLELPQRHPLADMAPLWQRFWNLERPTAPTAQDAAEVIRECGFAAQIREWEEDPGTRALSHVPLEQQVEFMRIRLCLTPERDAEIAEVMAQLPDTPRRLATIWWDVARW